MKTQSFRTINSLTLPAFSPDELARLCHAAQRFDVEKIRFTSGGQLAVSGLSDEAVDGFTSLLSQFMKTLPENSIGTVLSCPGAVVCKHGRGDTPAIAEQIQNLTSVLPLPAKVKIGISGCPRCCTMTRLRDIGLVTATRGFHLYFGGNGGGNPRISDCIGEHLNLAETLRRIQASLDIYREQAAPGMRTSRFIENITISVFRKKLQKRLSS